jgi:hypothetical protein
MTANQEDTGHESNPRPQPVTALALVVVRAPRVPGLAFVMDGEGVMMMGAHLQAAGEKQTGDTEGEDGRDADRAMSPPSKEERSGCEEDG